MYPQNVDGFSIATTKIYVTWENLPVKYFNGDLKGYHVKYKKYFDEDWKVRFIDYGYLTCTLENLEPFTLYWIDVAAVNQFGEGPTDYAIVKTLEGGDCFFCNALFELFRWIPLEHDT